MIAAAPPRGWLLQTWGDEAVAFDAASGDTHYLAPFTRRLYETCRDHPGLTAAMLADLLAEQLAVTPDTDFLNAVDEALASLRRIGLLRAP